MVCLNEVCRRSVKVQISREGEGRSLRQIPPLALATDYPSLGTDLGCGAYVVSQKETEQQPMRDWLPS